MTGTLYGNTQYAWPRGFFTGAALGLSDGDAARRARCCRQSFPTAAYARGDGRRCPRQALAVLSVATPLPFSVPVPTALRRRYRTVTVPAGSPRA